MASNRYLFCCSMAGMFLGAVPMSRDLLAQKADLHADMGNLTVRHQTQHYAIAGTISDARLVEYGRCLEYIYHEYLTGFGELTSDSAATIHADDAEHARKNDKALPNPMIGSFGNRFPVIIFAKSVEYDQFGAKYFPQSLEHTRGVFLRSLKLLVIRDDPDSSQTYEVLFHEAFHQFAHRFTPHIPTWANEGLATYYGHARPTDSGLRFDRPAVSYFSVVQDARTAKALIPLHQLMAMSQAHFLGSDRVGNLDLTHRTLCYAQSYTLVSYMLSDPAGAAYLRAYLKDLADAKSHSEANSISDRYFDRSRLESMTQQWLAYCQKY